MTKRRQPLSMENTLGLTIAQLGMDRAVQVTGRDRSYLHALTDPDRPFLLTFRDGQALDEDFYARVERRHPLYETYGLIVRANRPELIASACDFAAHAVEVARESSEAIAALVVAAVHGAPVDQCDDAVRQLEESIAAATAALTDFRTHIARQRAGKPPP